MIGHFSSRKKGKAASLRSLDRLASRTEAKTEPSSSAAPTQSRRDFLQSLELLGARPSLCTASGEKARRTLPVLVSCSYGAWRRLFGEPQEVATHNVPSARETISVWRHSCTDGPVTCIGHLSERSPGVRWVILIRVGFY